MPQEVLRQVAFNAGELDPALTGRRDLKDYGRSLASARNLVFQAQGPLLRRPGCAIVDFIRGPFEAFVVTSGMVVTPNGGGGDVDNLVDRDEATSMSTTSPMGATNPYEVFRIDLGDNYQLHAVDIVDYAVVNAPGDPVVTPVPPPLVYTFIYDPGRFVVGGWQYVPL